MNHNLKNFFRRDADPSMNPTMSTLSIVLLVLLIITVLLMGALLFLRYRRKTLQARELPMYSEQRISTISTHSRHRRVNVRPSRSIHIYQEKEISERLPEPETPTDALPEIRITFPEEFDASGKWQSGRVVVVHVGDSGVALEPLADTDKLPSYQQSAGQRFDSVDLERVGGLFEKEKEGPPRDWKQFDGI